MKPTFCFTLTLLILITPTFVVDSYAENVTPQYVVRQIYFYPSDREPSDALEAKIDAMVKDIQQFFADEMVRHGFERKTFKLETDENGNSVKHRIKGKLPSSHYYPVIHNRIAREEFEEHLGIPERVINVIFVLGIFDDRPDHLGTGGGAWGDPFSGTAMIELYNYDENELELGNIRAWTIIAHEIAHTFGLLHDFRDDRDITSYGIDQYRDRLSYCAAKWLDVHRYFNTAQNDFDQLPHIRELESSLISPPNTVRLRFRVTHTAELHHAFLQIGSFNMVDCGSLSGNSNTIEFVTTELIPKNNSATLWVIDVYGNYMGLGLLTDLSFLLPDTAPVPISIPDANLAAAIRKSLSLPEESHITDHDILNLKSVHSSNSSEITDLTGLEHALNLKDLPLWNNQIVDLTPLTELKNLRYLHLGKNQIIDLTPLAGLTELRKLTLEDNQIRDITPLAGLTNLHELHLGANQILDVNPLAKLTNVYNLSLYDNQITDVSPLAEFVNLKTLYLIGNQIKNRKPLLELLRRNPDIKIYLKSHFEPLPVILSHFRAQHTDVGVVLKWTTESEVDNAGFYIYRSKKRDGEFKVINATMIEGAGTTGERNNYTWTDTTAKLNTVYYYRIEDVSNAGLHKQLATVRLRGLVSVEGKLTTSWADLKVKK